MPRGSWFVFVDRSVVRFIVDVTIAATASESTASKLQTCPACGAFIDTSEAEPLASVECPNCGEKVRAELMFDNFVIVETVGVGGMGTVYKARDTLLDRFVALRLLRKDLEGGLDETAQLQQEARMAASVNHPTSSRFFHRGRITTVLSGDGRQWLCAVYANFTGQVDAARQLAEAAAQSKPEYRDLISLVVQ